MNKVLEIRNITVRFGGVVAVQGASLTINDGQLIGFIGPNGAGKTTLMRVVTGIVMPTEGDVLLLGNNITSWPINVRVQAGLAFAQQIVQPLVGMTLLDNVALACGISKTMNPLLAMISTERAQERARARELLGLVGLADVADRFPKTLPLGVRKRLEMARAMALDPKLLLLDEPLAGLNQAEAHSLADLIRDLNAHGQTILLIEHNLREVMRICPMLYVQDQGRPLAFGETAEVMTDPVVRQAYLGGHS